MKFYDIVLYFLDFLQGMILTFDNPNWLWIDGSRKFMRNPLIVQKMEVRILKFCAMLTSIANNIANVLPFSRCK